jgi:hypothetical protein
MPLVIIKVNTIRQKNKTLKTKFPHCNNVISFTHDAVSSLLELGSDISSTTADDDTAVS